MGISWDFMGGSMGFCGFFNGFEWDFMGKSMGKPIDFTGFHWKTQGIVTHLMGDTFWQRDWLGKPQYIQYNIYIYMYIRRLYRALYIYIERDRQIAGQLTKKQVIWSLSVVFCKELEATSKLNRLEMDKL